MVEVSRPRTSPLSSPSRQACAPERCRGLLERGWTPAACPVFGRFVAYFGRECATTKLELLTVLGMI